ncbi:bifunctional chorismate-binding protein/class IV aminotransferase, partial [Magnetococcales bacterium HHB-1]
RHQKQDKDYELGLQLKRSEKDLAEHVMIVDMARNDLGKVAKVGSVAVEKLCNLRKFPTLYHLETRVSGQIQSETSLAETFAALFPAASITGAPKKRTMEIIRDLECTPRGIYTGSLGVLSPGGDYIFNVAIRTLTQKKDHPIQLGLGGGIVADSKSQAEWQEIKDKGEFLNRYNDPGCQEIQLIETMRLNEEGFSEFFLSHLNRLQKSADALGFICDIKAVERALKKEAQKLLGASIKKTPLIIRILLNQGGQWSINHRPLKPPLKGLKIKVFSTPMIDHFDPLLRYKTDRRTFFDYHYKEALKEGYDDVLFQNSQGHITEGAIRAVALKRDGVYQIPPLKDGLLDSLWRQKILENSSVEIKSFT